MSYNNNETSTHVKIGVYMNYAQGQVLEVMHGISLAWIE